MHSEWLANIVPMTKRNGQIRVCIDFRDFNDACPKDDFSMPITKIMIDNTFGYVFGYNQIKMNLKDEKHTSF